MVLLLQGRLMNGRCSVVPFFGCLVWVCVHVMCIFGHICSSICAGRYHHAGFSVERCGPLSLLWDAAVDRVGPGHRILCWLGEHHGRVSALALLAIALNRANGPL
eukprot:3791682-Amphidinium_carterae.1